MSGNVTDTENRAVNKTDTNLCAHGAHILVDWRMKDATRLASAGTWHSMAVPLSDGGSPGGQFEFRFDSITKKLSAHFS